MSEPQGGRDDLVELEAEQERTAAESRERQRVAIQAAILCVSILFVAWFLVVVVWGKFFSLADAASFGDAFGPVNTIFSGLGLVGIAVTLYLSQQQLAVQQRELRNSITEMREQRRQMEVQNAFLAKQGIRSQFFELLQTLQNVKRDIRMEPSLTGGDALTAIVSNLRSKLARREPLDPVPPLEVRRTQIHVDFLKARRSVQLGHYFRLFYHVIRFVDLSAELTVAEKQNLARLLRAHLSGAEFVLLFYSSVLPTGENLHPLIEKYDLLQNMWTGVIANPMDVEFYPETKARWLAKGRWPPTSRPVEPPADGTDDDEPSA